jgi:non-specific protein-tyrosine kinase
MAINLITLTDPTSPAAEAYRQLRVNLLAAGRATPLHTLLVAPVGEALALAAGRGDDKASTVANLAVAFARVGKRVVLADCDLHHPAQHTIFGLENRAGVTTALTAPLPPNVGGQSAPQKPALSLRAEAPSLHSGQALKAEDLSKGWGAGEAALPLQATEVPGLRVLTSGPAVDAPSDLIASPAMSDLIARLCAEADIVLFDAPPVLQATDAAELAVQVDGVLLTVHAGHTKREEARRAKELLEQIGARLLGAALLNAS